MPRREKGTASLVIMHLLEVRRKLLFPEIHGWK
jgi:hypothetical protein